MALMIGMPVAEPGHDEEASANPEETRQNAGHAAKTQDFRSILGIALGSRIAFGIPSLEHQGADDQHQQGEQYQQVLAADHLTEC